MVADPVHDRAHPMFANSKMDVAAFRFVAGKVTPAVDVVEGRAVKICTPADQKRHRFGHRL